MEQEFMQWQAATNDEVYGSPAAAAPPQITQPTPPTAATEVEPLVIAAASVTVNFFGVVANDAFLKEHSMKPKMGPTGKGSSSFAHDVGLLSEEEFDTMGDFANYALNTRLGLSVDDLIGNRARRLGPAAGGDGHALHVCAVRAERRRGPPTGLNHGLTSRSAQNGLAMV